MSIAGSAQSLASQQEWVRPELEDLALSSSVLWKRIQKNTEIKAISGRPARVPTMPSTGGKPKKGNLNGGDMGIGSGPSQVPGQIITTTYIMAFSYTADAEYQTDSDEKAIEDFSTLTRSIAPKKFADFLDITLQGNGNDQIDSIVGLTVEGANTVGIVVTNANFFLDDQDVDIFNVATNPPTFIATVTVESSDILSNTIWLDTPIPTASLTVGNGLFINGASGLPNTGMFGLRYYGVNTNTGNWLNVQRSAWPGKYNMPTIPVNGALTPQIVRALQSLVELSKGEDAMEDDCFAHCNVDARDAWEQNALLVQYIDMSQAKGDSSMDMLKRNSTTSIAGREMVVNPRALPGFIDFQKAKHLSMVETKAVDFYDVGGQTLFPVYGQSGGLVSAMVFYLVYEGQLLQVNTREQAFLSGITTPRGLFGK
jgi:hypothetical protein